ncbi:hypothetical protein QYE76_058170 [Lolium multiflorum]|uniref:SKP1 component POZ domain-containing protein n=1 Tax=Lolium multiflorum TaxID=4521 RepID=A0AAD8T6C5_LOLMU|nr:hypothetical protein QYE76_058170 [Lolium multiflorum]
MAAGGVEEAENTFLLKSSDGAEFVVSDPEASQSRTIHRQIECMVLKDSAIHLGVKSNILSKAIEYIKKHLESDASGGGTWGAKFVDVDHETLCDFIIASDCLCIQGLLELASHTLKNKIKGKSPQEIRTMFNITSGSPPLQQDEEDVDGLCAFMDMVNDCDFEAHANRDLTSEEKSLKALDIVRRQEFIDYDPKLNDFMCTRLCLFNMAFFDIDEESTIGRGQQLHPRNKLIEESSINVISLKICESDVGFPINLFGTVIARDEVDYKCVYLFRREADDPQFITSPDDMLALMDPCRGLVASDKIYFEINLKIKTDSGAIEDFSKGLLVFNSDCLSEDEQSKTSRLTSWLSDVELTCAHVLDPMEATIAINLLKGQCNISRVEAWTTENSEDHMILYENKAEDTQIVIDDGGTVPLTRRVVAVPLDEKVVLSLVGDDESEPLVLTLGQTDEVHACKMGCGELQVKIAWTAIPERRKYNKWEFVGDELLML